MTVRDCDDGRGKIDLILEAIVRARQIGIPSQRSMRRIRSGFKLAGVVEELTRASYRSSHPSL